MLETLRNVGTGVRYIKSKQIEEEHEENSCVEFQQHAHSIALTRTLSMVSQLSQIRVELEMKQLWNEFNQFSTEMIVTKAGRYVQQFHLKIHQVNFHQQLDVV